MTNIASRGSITGFKSLNHNIIPAVGAMTELNITPFITTIIISGKWSSYTRIVYGTNRRITTSGMTMYQKMTVTCVRSIPSLMDMNMKMDMDMMANVMTMK